MKPLRFFAMLAMLLVFLSACEGEENEEGKSKKEHNDAVVPAAVQTAFSSSYATATDIKWGMEDADFEVDFMRDGVESSVVYDAAGSVLMTESAVAIAALPPAIMEYVNANYANYTSIKAEMAMETGKGMSYEIILSSGGSAVELVFDQEGQWVKVADEEDEASEGDEEGEEDDDDEAGETEHEG